MARYNQASVTPAWPIGFQLHMVDGEAVQTMLDGSVWARNGAYVSNSSAPQISGSAIGICEGLKVTGNPVTLPASYAFSDVALNGGGACIATWLSNSTTNFLASSNNGQTWATLSSAMANTPVSICYGNSRFVGVSASGNSCYSTSGTSFTAGGSTGSGTGKVTVQYCPTINLFVSCATQTSGAPNIYTTTDATTWTSRTVPTFSANPTGEVTIACNGSLICIIFEGNAQYLTSSDGITWTLRSWSSSSPNLQPSSITKRSLAALGSTFVFAPIGFTGTASNNNAYITTDPTTPSSWTAKAAIVGGYTANIPGTGEGALVVSYLAGWLYSTGTYILASMGTSASSPGQSSFLWTSDFTTWHRRTVYAPMLIAHAIPTPAGNGTNVITFPGSVTTSSYADVVASYSTGFPNSDYVGLPNYAKTGVEQAYVRVN